MYLGAQKLGREVGSLYQVNCEVVARLVHEHMQRLLQSGLGSIEDDLGSLMITQAVKMLTSPDPLVRGMAQHYLTLTIEKRYGDIEGLEDKWAPLGWSDPVSARGLPGRCEHHLVARTKFCRRQADSSARWD